MTDPVQAMRLKPGEYRLPVTTVEPGLRFQYRDAVYEVVSDPTPIGTRVVIATIRMIVGRAAGKDFQAVLHTSSDNG